MFSAYMNMSFRWKLSLPMLFLATVVLYMGLYSINTAKTLGHDTNQIAKVNLPEIQLLIQADRDLYQALTAERALIDADASQMPALLKEFAENAAQAHDRTLKSMDTSNTATNAERTEFLDRYNDWKSHADSVISAVKAHDEASLKKAKQLTYGETYQSFLHLRSYLDELEDKRLAVVDQFTANSDKLQADIALKLGSLVAIGALLSAVVAFFLPLVVTRPLNNIAHRIQNIADGDGDLTIRLPVTSQDEVGELSQHVNQFMEKLQALVRDVLGTAGDVSKSAETLLSVSSQSQRMADEQCNAITMVATAVNELTAAIQEVARNTSDTAQSTKEAADITDEGQARILSAVDQVRSLTTSISETANIMKDLDEQAKSVTSVVDVIRGVAEQTNLLALNAAIEAARAGEQGRGFAVVADEVRTLASRTQQSTADIQGMLSKLQAGVKHAAESMSTSTNATNVAADSAYDAGNSLSGISNAVKQISNMTVQIAAAAEEQSSVTAEIDKSLVEINTLALGAADGATKTAEESQRLNNFSVQLKTRLGQFRV